MQRVRLKGEWEAWLEFFLTAVQETSTQAVAAIHALQNLFLQDEERLLKKQGRSTKTILRVYRYLQSHPMTTIANCLRKLNSTVPTVTSAIEQLRVLGIVKELTGQERNRLYSYEPYIRLLGEGAGPVTKL